jgi:hypothetical protein
VIAKPTVEELGIDVDAQVWHRSGGQDGSIEVAFTGSARLAGNTPDGSARLAGNTPDGEEWVLLRVAGDTAGRVLVYDRFEWECFLDGVKKGEFDEAAELPSNSRKWPGRRPSVTLQATNIYLHNGSYRTHVATLIRPGRTGPRPGERGPRQRPITLTTC